jgi:hypothetical protein
VQRYDSGPGLLLRSAAAEGRHPAEAVVTTAAAEAAEEAAEEAAAKAASVN